MVLMLAKAGWYGGNPSAILSAQVDWVVKSFHFENFINKYQNAEIEMSRK